MTRLPDFIIIGAQKCGTSAVMRLLHKHPDIGGIRSSNDPAWCMKYTPQHLEPHFFDLHWDRGVEWYQGLFETGDVLGEKSPSYISDAVALHRIATTIPNVKLIVMLRNPVARLVSNYQMIARRDQHDSLSFEDWIHSPAGAKGFWRGVYWKQLETVFALFPQKLVHVAFQEEMIVDNIGTMNEIQRFIGVEVIDLFEKPRVKFKPPMTNKTRMMLEDYYQAHTNMLYSMLPMRQVDAWRRSNERIRTSSLFHPATWFRKVA
jgi:hypothetical protein